jgi:hypothetical protein
MNKKIKGISVGLLGIIVLAVLFFIISGQKLSVDTKQTNVVKVSQENKAQLTSPQEDCVNKDKTFMASVKQKMCTEADEFYQSNCGGLFE